VQGKYENFKVSFEAYYQQQLDSLKLERDMKLAEIDELADRISSTVGSLRGNLSTLDSLQTELVQAGKDAVSHLALSRELQRKELVQQQEQLVCRRVQDFRDSIYIE